MCVPVDPFSPGLSIESPFSASPFRNRQAPAPLLPEFGPERLLSSHRSIRRCVGFVAFLWRPCFARWNVVVHRDRIESSWLAPGTSPVKSTCSDYLNHGLGFVIVAIGKKFVVVLVGIIETVPASSTRPQAGRKSTFRPGVYYNNCYKEGHNSDECYRLKGYPIGHPLHGKYKPPVARSVNVNDNRNPKGLNKRIAHGNLYEGLYIIYPDQLILTSPTVLTTSNKDNTILWHSRLGHPSTSTLKQIKSISTRCNSEISYCNVFPLAKNDASPFSLSTSHASYPFELVHLDIWGPYKSPTINKIDILMNKTDLIMTQRKYTLELLQSAGLLNVKPSSIPFDPITKLNHDDGDLLDDPSQYRTLVGNLLYLTITRPNISYAAQTLSQFIQAPRTPHLKALIKVLKYLKSCPGQGLIFQTNTTLNLKAFCDSKETVVSRSSTEAEYRALTDVTCELSWIKCLFKDLRITISSITTIYCDNASAIALASNPIQYARTKHIEIDCHFVRDNIRQGLILPTFIPTQHQLADVLTKGLSKAPHYHCLSQFGICDPYTLPT
ncbi:cysteine-rich receptor-like protein kinase 8 [Tanacetum coccineum]